MSKLAQCPFCGEKRDLVLSGCSDEDHTYYFVRCLYCQAHGSKLHAEEDAVSVWNRVSRVIYEQD